MRRCQCEQCSSHPSPTYTRQYLLECEARFVRSMPPHRRSEYLDAIERRRGPDGLRILTEAMRKLPPPRR